MATKIALILACLLVGLGWACDELDFLSPSEPDNIIELGAFGFTWTTAAHVPSGYVGGDLIDVYNDRRGVFDRRDIASYQASLDTVLLAAVERLAAPELQAVTFGGILIVTLPSTGTSSCTDGVFAITSRADFETCARRHLGI